MAAFGTIGNDEPAGAGHRHHHFSRPEQVGHLRDRRPPDDVRLDLVELAKGAVDSRWRPQRRIDLVGRHTVGQQGEFERSEEHTSELQSLMSISYAVFCLKKKKQMK